MTNTTSDPLNLSQKRVWTLEWAIQRAIDLGEEDFDEWVRILSEARDSNPKDLDLGLCSKSDENLENCGEAVMKCGDCGLEFCDECGLEHVHYTFTEATP